VCYQTYDLFKAMSDDGVTPKSLRVDGGMAHNSWMVQHLSNVLDIEIERPKVLETTALGTALLVGLQAGLYSSLEDARAQWQAERRFAPDMDDAARADLLAGWHKAVSKVLTAE